jgi:RNA recognition motif-containing protein
MSIEYKVFVSGLNLKTDKKDLEESKRLLSEHFQDCGDIEQVFVKPTFAFITFKSEEARDQALKLKNSTFMEKNINVSLPKDKQQTFTKYEPALKKSVSEDRSGILPSHLVLKSKISLI